MEKNLGNRLIQQHILISRVITQVSSVEYAIDSIIANFYTKTRPGANEESSLIFQSDILTDKYMTIFQKKDILFKVFKRLDSKRLVGGEKKAFDDWIHIRNIFAHSQPIGRESGLYLFFQGNNYDIEVESKRHAELQVRVLEVIERYSDLTNFGIIASSDE